MRTQISASALPVLHVALASGETLLAETGQLSWMTGDVQMRTTTAAAGATGFLGAVTRAFGGGGLFLTEFSTRGGAGELAFAARLPGVIVEVPLEPGGPAYLLHRHGFLCGYGGLTLGAAITRSLGAGIFGGDGFRLQRLSGQGVAFVELGGELVTRSLARGETLLVHPGHVGMFEENVAFEITLIRGVANALFGGEGLFMAKLTGPGRVWLQTLTLPGLAHALAPYLAPDSLGKVAKTGAGAAVTTEIVRGLFGRG